MKKCNNCGAENDENTICAYCGSLMIPVGDYKEEIAAINELHLHVSDGDENTQKRILRNGYIPDHKKAIIESGIRCIPLIDLRDPYDEPVKSAMQRLSAITTKLKILSDDEETRRALEQFNKIIKDYKKNDASNTFWGFVLVIGIISLLVFLFRFFFI